MEIAAMQVETVNDPRPKIFALPDELLLSLLECDLSNYYSFALVCKEFNRISCYVNRWKIIFRDVLRSLPKVTYRTYEFYISNDLLYYNIYEYNPDHIRIVISRGKVTSSLLQIRTMHIRCLNINHINYYLDERPGCLIKLVDGISNLKTLADRDAYIIDVLKNTEPLFFAKNIISS